MFGEEIPLCVCVCVCVSWCLGDDVGRGIMCMCARVIGCDGHGSLSFDERNSSIQTVVISNVIVHNERNTSNKQVGRCRPPYGVMSCQACVAAIEQREGIEQQEGRAFCCLRQEKFFRSPVHRRKVGRRMSMPMYPCMDSRRALS